MSQYEEFVEVILGLPPLRGPEPRLRLAVAAVWEPVVFVTVIAAGPALSLNVIISGSQTVDIMKKAVAEGTPPTPDPTRRVYTGRALTEHEATLSRHMNDTAWALTDRASTGMDGHTVTTDVYDPARGTHRAQQWCPPHRSAMGELMWDLVLAGGTLDPTLLERYWVREARDARAKT
ncbi:MAG: hypothetical protein AAF799_41400 [Myxococcota bacterium]